MGEGKQRGSYQQKGNVGRTYGSRVLKREGEKEKRGKQRAKLTTLLLQTQAKMNENRDKPTLSSAILSPLVLRSRGLAESAGKKKEAGSNFLFCFVFDPSYHLD